MNESGLSFYRKNPFLQVDSLVGPGDKDSQFVYFLAFKLHCIRNELEEAVDMFR